MNKETLLVELDRLLDAGEPLLTLFPKKHPEIWTWELALPDNISPEMKFYAFHVALRAHDRKAYSKNRQQYSTDRLATRSKRCEVGLLGWRAIGVLL